MWYVIDIYCYISIILPIGEYIKAWSEPYKLCILLSSDFSLLLSEQVCCCQYFKTIVVKSDDGSK